MTRPTAHSRNTPGAPAPGAVVTRAPRVRAGSRGLLPALVAACLAVAPPAPDARAQSTTNHVYVDDSPGAVEGLARAADHIAKDRLDEAARVLQEVIDEEGERVVGAPDSPGLYITVRRRVNELLLSRPALLEEYRRQEGPVADRMLAEGEVEAVERSRLLTGAGFEAVLRLAQRRLEAAQFEAAWRLLQWLERHPDRLRPEPGRDAAQMAALVARYLGRDEARAVAQRWAVEAGLAPADAPAVDGPQVLDGLTPFDAAPRVDLAGIVSRPLWSEPLDGGPFDEEEAERFDARRPGRRGEQAWYVLPTIAGDSIYVNDGVSVAAWDRFTLAPRFRTRFVAADEEEPEGVRRGFGAGSRPNPDDTLSVTVHDRWALAVVGNPQAIRRSGENEIVALDAQTGAERWRAALAEADPSLAEATVRGRLLVDQGVVIAVVSKDSTERRLVSTSLVGFDLASGAPLWRRQLGAVGTLPFNTVRTVADAPTLDRGVVYVADSLGFVAAVDSVTGRTIWVRDLQGEDSSQQGRDSWQALSPAIIGGTLYTVTPGNSALVALDTLTGAVVASRPLADLVGSVQQPFYLAAARTGAGDRLVLVGESAAYALDPAAVRRADGAARRFLEAPGGRLLGRALVTGERLLAPVQDGVVAAPILAPGDESAEPQTLIALDQPGNALAMESQIVVVDDRAVRTYLMWEAAERVLSGRVAAAPDDPAPAVTLAELAYRAGKPDRVIPAVESALDSIERDPLSPRNAATRRRLFQSLLTIIEPDRDDPQMGSLSRDRVETLIEHLGRAAAAPEERVRHLMARGAFFEAEGRAALAIESYQRVLDEPALAQARYVSRALASSASAEATKSLRRVVRRYGAESYAAFEAEARRRYDAVRGGIDPEAFAEIARRYPVSRTAAQAWLDAATAYVSRGRPHGAIFALESGLLSADDSLAWDDPLVGELAGRLVVLLSRTGRVAAAVDALDRFRAERPLLTLTDGGAAISAESLQRELHARLESLERRPRIGLLEAQPRVSRLDGWSIVTPIRRRFAGKPTDSLVMASAEEFALWEVDPAGGVRLRWSIPADENLALIDHDDEAVYVSGRTDAGRVITRLDARTGLAEWTTPTFEEMFGPPPPRPEPTVSVPLDGDRPLTELVVALDESTLTMVDRVGRAAAFDLRTGRRLWAAPTTLDGVHDMAVGSGVLALVGAVHAPNGEQTPALLLIDSRTGQTQHRAEVETGPIRWVRVTDAGEAILATERAVSLYDVFTGARRWTVAGAAGRETIEAWVFPGRVIVMGVGGGMHQIETENGRAGEPLDTRQRVSDRMPLVGAAVSDNVVFTSMQGVLLYDRRGALIGADHRSTQSFTQTAELAADYFVVLGFNEVGRDDDLLLIELQLLSTESCALAQRKQIGLLEKPIAVALLDGRILVTAAPGTSVIDAPAAP